MALIRINAFKKGARSLRHYRGQRLAAIRKGNEACAQCKTPTQMHCAAILVIAQFQIR